ncbi:pantetheine-phosphate adenylyltransferase [Halostella sp. JP-L12]|uniref:phosphopantetheine adenylyltransferase n=1 Tax=Halostella TaxID=1843185 RepID=UPI000EF82FEB|nr:MULTISPECIES: pantetheine-phosphate adenylyltransferase [Halostella]NHN49487.1 pantetheine-phosphate adenylyltransferase [Halostella sp. JP-L12]
MRVVVAGTFGPIHDGHRALFTEALERGDEGVVVGLTSDALARSSREREVPPFEERRERVRAEFDRLDEWDRDVEIRRIDDERGFAATDPTLDAIVVSPETDEAVASINRRREENGMNPLTQIVVPHVLADDGDPISSTRIVRGEIDEHGNAE